MRHVIPSTLVVLATAASAFAQSGGSSAEEYQTIGDYRWALYTACSLVFGAIAVYLIMTHQRGAKLGEDIEHLERRIEELER